MDTLFIILKVLLLLYVGFDISLTLIGFPPFVITRFLIRSLLGFILGKYGCKFHIHKWKYTTKNADTENDANQMTIYQRECMGICKKKQYSYYPQHSSLFDYWRDVEPK